MKLMRAGNGQSCCLQDTEYEAELRGVFLFCFVRKQIRVRWEPMGYGPTDSSIVHHLECNYNSCTCMMHVCSPPLFLLPPCCVSSSPPPLFPYDKTSFWNPRLWTREHAMDNVYSSRIMWLSCSPFAFGLYYLMKLVGVILFFSLPLGATCQLLEWSILVILSLSMSSLFLPIPPSRHVSCCFFSTVLSPDTFSSLISLYKLSRFPKPGSFTRQDRREERLGPRRRRLLISRKGWEKGGSWAELLLSFRIFTWNFQGQQKKWGE